MWVNYIPTRSSNTVKLLLLLRVWRFSKFRNSNPGRYIFQEQKTACYLHLPFGFCRISKIAVPDTKDQRPTKPCRVCNARILFRNTFYPYFKKHSLFSLETLYTILKFPEVSSLKSPLLNSFPMKSYWLSTSKI